MQLSGLTKKLCMDEAYGIAIRKCDSPSDVFSPKYPTFFDWYADPFVCTWNGRSWVFAELMNSYHVDGQIAVAPVVDAAIGDFTVILGEPFHMSFPNVFSWRGTWYMIPETYKAKELRLYRCKDFPYAWELDAVLLQGEELVDSALYPCEDGFFVVAHDIGSREKSVNRVFRLDMDGRAVADIHPEGNWRRERPGGTFWQADGAWYHALQDCEKCYGDYLHICRVDCFSGSEFREEEVKTVRVEDLAIAPMKHRLEHTHTYNTDGVYEVYDFRYDKVYWDKFFIHQWKELRKRLRKR